MIGLVFSFFFKKKTAFVMRISDWSSDVCSSDLRRHRADDRRRLARTPNRLSPLPLRPKPLYSPRHPRGGCVKEQVESGTARDPSNQTGSASCRGSVCQYV